MAGSLRDHLPTMSFLQRLNALIGAAQGLHYLHSTLVVNEEGHRVYVLHRDLKADNILVSSDLFQVKLSDFGLSRTITSVSLAKSRCGTPGYLSPEVLKRKASYGSSADVFAFGMVIYEVLSGLLPFHTVDHVAQIAFRIADGDLPDESYIPNEKDPFQIVQQVIQVMSKCCKFTAEVRPSITQVLASLKAIRIAAAAAHPSSSFVERHTRVV
jgi:serine/threonine-protein kinase